MKRKDVISFLGMICYIIFVFGGLRMYFTTDECYDENELSCMHQNSTFDIEEYDEYLE